MRSTTAQQKWTWGILALLIALLTFAAASASAQGLTKIAIHTYPGSLVSLYPHLGVARGFYAAEGLDATTVDINSGPEANAALAGGSVQFVLNTSDNLLLAESRGFRVVSVVGNQVRNFYSLVVRSDLGLKNGASARDIAQALVGKRIGVIAAGSNNERFTQALIAAGGVEFTKVMYVPLGGPANQLAAMTQKTIEAHLGWEPFLTITALKGLGTVVIDCRIQGQCPEALEKPGRAFQTYYTSRSFLESNPKAVEAFVRAHRKIDAWVHDPRNRSALVEAVGKLVPPGAGIDPTKYASSVVESSIAAFGVTIDPAGLDAWSEQLVRAKLIPKAIPAASVLWQAAPRP